MKNPKVGMVIVGLILICAAVGAFLIVRNSSHDNKEDVINIDDYVSVSANNLMINTGSTGEFDIIIKGAVGRIDLTSDSDNIMISEDSIWLESIDENPDKKTITVTALDKGSGKINVKLTDVAIFETEEVLNGSLVINVNVE